MFMDVGDFYLDDRYKGVCVCGNHYGITEDINWARCILKSAHNQILVSLSFLTKNQCRH